MTDDYTPERFETLAVECDHFEGRHPARSMQESEHCYTCNVANALRAAAAEAKVAATEAHGDVQ